MIRIRVRHLKNGKWSRTQGNTAVHHDTLVKALAAAFAGLAAEEDNIAANVSGSTETREIVIEDGNSKITIPLAEFCKPV